jgi:hypothetical protein
MNELLLLIQEEEEKDHQKFGELVDAPNVLLAERDRRFEPPQPK